MKTYALTVSDKSTCGVVAAITGLFTEKCCYIVDSYQFDDLDTGRFFMRLSFINQHGATIEEIVAGLEPVETTFGMTAEFHHGEAKMKVLLMVSRFGYCLNDLLYPWKIGALPIEIVGVVPNHFDYHKVIVNHDMPFNHIPVTKAVEGAVPRSVSKLFRWGTTLCRIEEPSMLVSSALVPVVGSEGGPSKNPPASILSPFDPETFRGLKP